MDAQVNVGGIAEPCDQSHGFFRIPGPIRAPRVVCPEPTCDDADGEQRESDCYAAVADVVIGLSLFGIDIRADVFHIFSQA